MRAMNTYHRSFFASVLLLAFIALVGCSGAAGGALFQESRGVGGSGGAATGSAASSTSSSSSSSTGAGPADAGPDDGATKGDGAGAADAADAETTTDAGSCAHSLCGDGVALDPTCDPCVAAICKVAPDCCSDSWTIGCVARADTVCGDGGVLDYCGRTGTCPHDVCTTGTALESGCSLCAWTVCASEPGCCSVAWIQACADAVTLNCQLPCP